MSAVTVEVGDLVDAATEVVARPVRADGAAVTSAGRRLELAAGPAVTRHLAGLGDLPPGSAVLTPGGDLAAAYVLHLVVRSAEEPLTVATVRRALEQGLARVADWGLGSLTLPALGTGVGGLEIETAAALVADVIAGADAFRASGGRVVILVDSDYEREVFTRALT